MLGRLRDWGIARWLMVPADYLAKKVESRPQWIKSDRVEDIYSVSGCVSRNFCDYISLWKHNGWWLFDTPEKIAQVAEIKHVDLSEYKIFYYEIYEKQFDDKTAAWELFEPEKSLETKVVPPSNRSLAGYDVVSFFARTSPECSPLSCNSLAETIPVNAHCLIPSLDEAIRLVEAGAFENSEPGPYRIFAVYTVDLS